MTYDDKELNEILLKLSANKHMFPDAISAIKSWHEKQVKENYITIEQAQNRESYLMDIMANHCDKEHLTRDEALKMAIEAIGGSEAKLWEIESLTNAFKRRVVKVVIDRKGSFKLSKEALIKLYKKGSPFILVIDPKTPENSLVMDVNDETGEFLGYAIADDGNFICLNHRKDCKEFRTSDELLELVESLGEKASGYGSEIDIVEIPDDIKWYIEHGDEGFGEFIAEEHRRFY